MLATIGDSLKTKVKQIKIATKCLSVMLYLKWFVFIPEWLVNLNE